MGDRSEIDLPVYLVDLRVQSSTDGVAGSECLGGCEQGDGSCACTGRSFGVRQAMGHDPEQECQGK